MTPTHLTLAAVAALAAAGARRRRGGTNVPGVLYHGTGREFESFDLSYGGDNTEGAGTDKAVFLAKHEADAWFYAQKSGTKTGTEVMLTCIVDVRNPLIIDADDYPLLDDDDAAICYAQDHGHDAVIWPGGNINNSDWTIAVFDPDSIRIIHRQLYQRNY